MRDPNPDRTSPIEAAIVVAIITITVMVAVYFPTILKLFKYHKPVCHI